MDIIVTIGQHCDDKSVQELICKSMECGLDFFRFNLSKFRSLNDAYAMTQRICSYRDKYNIRVMIDLPFPYEKPRLFVRCGVKEILPGEEFQISTSIDDKSEIYTDCRDILSLKNGDRIIYSDGECVFFVKRTSQDGVFVYSNTKCSVYNSKSISFGILNKKKFEKDWVYLINSIEPQYTALSFVSSKSDIEEFKSFITFDTNIISKIETQQGIDNIEEILSVSDVMVARGDLFVNADFRLIGCYQDYIINMANRKNRNVYVATGILNSLYDRSLPTIGDMTDIEHILRQNPNGLILNYGIARNNLLSAANIIRFLEKETNINI